MKNWNSQAVGELPEESPYLYATIIEVSGLDALGGFLGKEDGKLFVHA